ncbi:MAG: hypothetical protein M1831_000253 [Alyxoria varia]|nr:MAG: hypothetical protein M1831_000253 [Alyxoria varia]
MSIPPPLIHNMAIKYEPALPILKTSTWVAILRHDVQNPNDIQDMQSFLYLKCHPNISIRTLRMHYFQRYPLDELMLLHRGRFIDDFTLVGMLRENYKPEDAMVAFHAVEVAELSDKRLRSEAEEVMVKNKGNFTGLGPKREGRDQDHAITILSDEEADDSGARSDSSNTENGICTTRSKRHVEPFTDQQIDLTLSDDASDQEVKYEDEAGDDASDGPNASEYIESNLPTLWKRMGDLSDEECHFLIGSLRHQCEVSSCRRELYLKNWTRLGAKNQPLCFDCSSALLKWQGASKEEIDELNREAMDNGVGKALLKEEDREPVLDGAGWCSPASFATDYRDELEEAHRWEDSEQASDDGSDQEMPVTNDDTFVTAREHQHSFPGAPVSQFGFADSVHTSPPNEGLNDTFVTAQEHPHSSRDAPAFQCSTVDSNRISFLDRGFSQFPDNHKPPSPELGGDHMQWQPSQQAPQSRNGWLGDLRTTLDVNSQQEDVPPSSPAYGPPHTHSTFVSRSWGFSNLNSRSNPAASSPIYGDWRQGANFASSSPPFSSSRDQFDFSGPPPTYGDPYQTSHPTQNTGMAYTSIPFTRRHSAGYQTQNVGMAYTPIPFTGQQHVTYQAPSYQNDAFSMGALQEQNRVQEAEMDDEDDDEIPALNGIGGVDSDMPEVEHQVQLNARMEEEADAEGDFDLVEYPSQTYTNDAFSPSSPANHTATAGTTSSTHPSNPYTQSFHSPPPSTQWQQPPLPSHATTAPHPGLSTAASASAVEDHREDEGEWQGIASEASAGEEPDEILVDAGALADDEDDGDYMDSEQGSGDDDGEDGFAEESE